MTQRSRYAALSMTHLMAACIVSIGCSTRLAQSPAEHPHIQIVRDHFECFNNHDAAGVRALATDGVAWYTIDNDRLVTNSSGAEQLESSLQQYFTAIPSVQASLDHIHAEGSYAMARERVNWTNAKGMLQSQSSYSCYEIIDGKIHAVWYFPAERTRDSGSSD